MSEEDKFGVKMPMEVPAQLREFTVKSVDQVEQAFASFIEVAGKSASLIPAPITDISKKVLSITEANLKATFDHARKLAQTSDISEVMHMQSEFLKKQYAAMEEHMKQLGANALPPHNNEPAG
jgi:phasin